MALDNCHHVIKRIMAEVFSAEERRLSRIRDQLLQANKELHPKPHDGFRYRGETFLPEFLVKGTRTWAPLHSSLIDDADDYLRDKEQVWSDRQMISQILYTLLINCNNLQDIRDALPEPLVSTLPELSHFKRTREPGFTILNSVRTKRQLDKMIGRIEFYTTARFLY